MEKYVVDVLLQLDIEHYFKLMCMVFLNESRQFHQSWIVRADEASRSRLMKVPRYWLNESRDLFHFTCILCGSLGDDFEIGLRYIT